MGQVVLGLVFHNHQPIGNFGWINEEHYEKAYLPMVEALERHPGVRPDDLSGCYLTEDDGRPFAIFASLYSLRYTIPWRSVDETIALLRGLADNAPEGRLPIAVMGDDGEKFGAWPSTYEHVWRR